MPAYFPTLCGLNACLSRLRFALAGFHALFVLFFAGSTFAEEPKTAMTAEEKPIVTIVLLDAFTPQFYIDTFTPLIEHLTKTLPQYRFETREFPASGLQNLNDLPADSFFVLSSGAAVRHDGWALQQIATRRVRPRDVDRSVGALFIVRSDSPYETLTDLKGRTAAASSADSFENWLIPMGEIADEGFDPEDFFTETVFSEWNYPDVPMLVSLGHADVGFLGTCSFENGIADGSINPEAFRVLNEKTDSNDVCRRSTALYPDAMFAARPGADADIVKLLTIAVLTMPENEGADWVSNTNLTHVRSLMHALALGPYEYLRDWSLRGLWQRFRLEILLFIAFAAAVGVHIVRTNLLVRRRTSELLAEAALHEAASEALSKSKAQLDRMERAGMASMLSAMFAHEIKQPLTNVVNFLSGIKMLISQRTSTDDSDAPRISSALDMAINEAYRAADIVDRVRSAAKRHAPQRTRVVMQTIVDEAVRHSQAAKMPQNLERLMPAEPIVVTGDALELQLIVVNFLNNAAAAVSNPVLTPRPRIDIVLENDEAEGHMQLIVIDNGPKLSDAQFETLGRLTESAKQEGLGFGLAIAASIAEAHGGRLFFHRRESNGLCAGLTLPLAPNDYAQPAIALRTDQDSDSSAASNLTPSGHRPPASCN